MQLHVLPILSVKASLLCQWIRNINGSDKKLQPQSLVILEKDYCKVVKGLPRLVILNLKYILLYYRVPITNNRVRHKGAVVCSFKGLWSGVTGIVTKPIEG